MCLSVGQSVTLRRARPIKGVADSGKMAWQLEVRWREVVVAETSYESEIRLLSSDEFCWLR